jgi:protein O-mannosyl-transferase
MNGRRPGPVPAAGGQRDRGWAASGWVLWVPAVVAVLCYLPALRNGFALDDVVIIADDGAIHHLSTLVAALGRPYWYDVGHLYRPLTTLSFGLEWTAGHGAPLLFHAVNIAWQAGISALVARLALRWWPAPAAVAAGLWFAIHPVHAEAVANIVGRSELVCAAALLGLTLLATAPSRAIETSTTARPGQDRLTLWLAFALAACAMASKETGVVAPAIVWAAAVTPLPADPRTPTARRALALRLTGAAAAGVGCLLAARWLILGTLAGDAPHYAFEFARGWPGLLLALATVPQALSLMLVPQPPRLDYSPPDSFILHPSPALVLLGAAIVAVAIAVLWRHARKPAPWSFVAAYAALTYAPVSNLLVRSGVVVADRTLYSPSVAIAIAAGAGIMAAWAARKWLVVGAAGVVATTGLWFTVSSLSAWKDSPAAFAAIRERSPSSYLGHFTTAELRDRAGDPLGAGQEYAIAVDLTPHNAAVLYMAAANAIRLRDTSRALRLLTRAMALRPDGARTRTALVGLELQRGDTSSARTQLRDGLAIDSSQRAWREELKKIGG